MIFETPEAVAHAQAEIIVRDAREAIAEHGTFSIALAGGSTPKATYSLLASDLFRNQIDWEHVCVFFGDERCVPPNDAQSNFLMASQTLLNHVPIPLSNIHRIRGEDEPLDAASAYAKQLHALFGPVPKLDLVLLGMGPDGHTASLFPGVDPLVDNEKLARAVYANSFSMWRITLTPLVFNAARHVLFAVTGTEKRDALRAVQTGNADPTRYPASVIVPATGTLSWLVDRAAGGEDSAPTLTHTQVH